MSLCAYLIAFIMFLLDIYLRSVCHMKSILKFQIYFLYTKPVPIAHCKKTDKLDTVHIRLLRCNFRSSGIQCKQITYTGCFCLMKCSAWKTATPGFMVMSKMACFFSLYSSPFPSSAGLLAGFLRWMNSKWHCMRISLKQRMRPTSMNTSIILMDVVNLRLLDIPRNLRDNRRYR